MSDRVTDAGTQASDRMGETAQHAGRGVHNLGARATDAMIGTDGNTASETVMQGGNRAQEVGQKACQGMEEAGERAAHAAGMGNTGAGATGMGTQMGERAEETAHSADKGGMGSEMHKAAHAMGMDKNN